MKTLYTLLLAASAALPLQALAETYHIYVSRHAEKASDSKDPPLTEAGELRARHIAGMLKDASIRQVYSTPYQRTRQTAAPTAAQFKLPIQEYDAGKQAEFARQLRSNAGGNLLVVGHSNTVPDLVRHLGGDPGGDMPETEYNRLYKLTVTDDGKVATAVLNSRP